MRGQVPESGALRRATACYGKARNCYGFAGGGHQSRPRSGGIPASFCQSPPGAPFFPAVFSARFDDKRRRATARGGVGRRGRLGEMDEKARALIRTLYELQIELFDHQGEEIEAVRKANAALQRSHEVIGKMLKLTADVAGFS